MQTSTVHGINLIFPRGNLKKKKKGKENPGHNVPLQGQQGSRGCIPDSPEVRPRLEGKQSTLLSSQVATGISWSPLSGLKGVKPPVKFGEKTRDCSPGQAGKEVPNLAMTVGFPELRRQCGVSHEV